MKPITYTLAAVAALIPSALNAGHCRQFFQAHHVQHHAVQANVLYFAGQSTQDEAIVRKVVREELKGALQLLQAQPQQQQTGSVLAAKCASCHSGDSPKGGVDLSGEVTDDVFRRSMEILAGENVPTAMKSVVAGLKDGDHAALMSEMLKRKPSAGVLR